MPYFNQGKGGLLTAGWSDPQTEVVSQEIPSLEHGERSWKFDTGLIAAINCFMRQDGLTAW